MAKVYLFGKMLDPELKQTTDKQMYLCFCLYANHESIRFNVYEKTRRYENGQPVMYDNSLFSLLADLPDGTPLMVSVNPAYSDKAQSLTYYLDDVYILDNDSQAVIRNILTRSL